MDDLKSKKLQLFAEGSGAAEAAAPAEAEGEAAGADEAVLDNSRTEEAGEESFESLIGGKYKAEFEKELSKRLEKKDREISGLNSSLEKHGALVDALAAKYDISKKNIDGILEAVADDDSFYEEAAAREGLTVHQYKEMQKLQKQQEEYVKLKNAELARTKAAADISKWFKQAESVKAEHYPDFDLKAELKNRDFVGLLKNGIDVKTAYEVFHMNELMESSARNAALNAEKNTVAKLQQKAARPVENGVNSQQGTVLKTAMSKLSKKDRADLAMRAQKGEIIKF